MNNLTVIIPTFNARESLLETLKSLELQSDPDFEVVIVDNNEQGCSDAYKEKIHKHNLNCRVIGKGQNLGAGGGRNFGVERTDSRIIAFTDDDCVVDKEWISVIKKNINESNKIIFGKVTSSIAPLVPFIHAFDMQGGVFGSGNCAFLRDFFVSLGGFDINLNNWAEDFEIGARAEREGARPVYVEQMLVEHPPKYVPFRIKNTLWIPASMDKYFYIIDKKKYNYKSTLIRDGLISTGKKAFVAGIFCLIPKIPFYFFPFVLSLLKFPTVIRFYRAWDRELFGHRFPILNVIYYLICYWFVDIGNLFLITYYLLLGKRRNKLGREISPPA